MTARKKKSTSRSNSNVQSAQRVAVERRLERNKAQQVSQAKANETKLEPAKQTGAAGQTRLEPVGGPLANRGRGIDQNEIAARDGVAGKSMSDAANQIAGLASGLMQAKQAEPKRALADTRLYGVSDKNIKDRLTALTNASNQARQATWTRGSAVYMGTKDQRIRRSIDGGDAEGGANRVPEFVQTDDVRNKDELMAWLADETTYNQIKKRMNKAGIDAQSYDDVYKVWASVVKQAADTKAAGKNVTPWALLSLRGKSMVNGKPQTKTGISTTVEEMDPAEARLILEKATSDWLGRAAKPGEIDDFISKAQTIAKQNPLIQNWSQQVGFDGNPNAQAEVTSKRGGASAVAAQAQVAAMDQAQQSEEYGAYQAAGPIFGWLTDALRSPV